MTIKEESHIRVQCSKDVLALCEVLENCDLRDFTDFLCDHFCDIVKSQNVLLPSALRSAVYQVTKKLFSEVSFREELKDQLKKVYANSGEDTLNLFIGPFVFKFFDKLLIHIFKVMHGQSIE